MKQITKEKEILLNGIIFVCTFIYLFNSWILIIIWIILTFIYFRETHLGELESKINIKLNELELRTNELNRRDEVLNQRLESINELSNGIDINKISSNVDSVSQQSEQVKQQSQLLKANFDNENAWWIYVWHQIQKKTYDSEEFKIDQSQINLKEYHATALHNQAMEIANLRQVSFKE